MGTRLYGLVPPSRYQAGYPYIRRRVCIHAHVVTHIVCMTYICIHIYTHELLSLFFSLSLSLNKPKHIYIYIDMYIYLYLSLYIYIYIYISIPISISLSLYTYIYIYIYTYRGQNRGVPKASRWNRRQNDLGGRRRKSKHQVTKAKRRIVTVTVTVTVTIAITMTITTMTTTEIWTKRTSRQQHVQLITQLMHTSYKHNATNGQTISLSLYIYIYTSLSIYMYTHIHIYIYTCVYI